MKKHRLAAAIAAISISPALLAQNTAENDGAGEEHTTEEVVVYGSYANSLDRAMDVKRQSATVMDAINAEDIGKFPAENVAEAMQMLPGIQIARSRGEGLSVSVRGLGPQFQVTQLNGRNLAVNENVENSGQDGRQFRYDTLPSELISGLEVVKSPEARLEEGAIGGIVNVKTFRPLELENNGAASAKLTHTELADSTDPKLSGLYRWVNEDNNLGILLSGAYSEREIRQDRSMNWNWIRGELESADAAQDFSTVFGNGRHRPTLERQNKERLSLASALQWKSSEQHEMNVDLLWSDLDVEFDEVGMDIELGGPVSNALLVGDSLVAGTAENTNLQLSRESSTSNHQSLSFAMNNRWSWDNWVASVDVSRSAAHSETDDPIRRTRLRLNDVAVGFDFSGGHKKVPQFSFPVDISDAQQFPGRRIEYRTIEVDDSDNSLKLDFEYLTSGVLSSVQFGVSKRDRERDYKRRDIRVSDGIDGVIFDDSYFESFPVSDFGDGISSAYLDNWAVPNGDKFHDEFFTDELLAQPLTNGDKRNSYKVAENITALYVQGNFDYHLGIPVFGNIGLRHVRTEQNPSGTSIINDLPVAVDYSQKYNKTLPSLNVNMELTDEWLMRVSAAKVMSRPSLPDLRPGITFSTDAPTASGGNPLLKPYEATQFDVSAEYYFSESGYASLTGFYKDINTFITGQSQRLNVNGTEVTLSAPANTGEGEIQGVELAYQQVLDFLPAPFDGLGVQANYTYVDSQVEVSENGKLVSQPVSGLSEHSYNLVAFYEKNGFAARLGYNWRDDYLAGNGVGDVADHYIDEFGTLDMNVSYEIIDDTRLSFEAVNITDESIYGYHDNSSRPGSIDHYGSRYALGISTKF